MATNSFCFVSPTLPLSRVNSVLTTPAQTSRRSTVTMSLRFPNGPRNPFNFGGGFNFGKFNGAGGFGGGNMGGSAGGNGGGPRRKGPGGAGGGAAGGSNPFASIWAAYNSVLSRHPITTKAFTSLVGFFLGDLIAQKFLGEKGAPLDRARLLRMAAFGFLVHGPTGHYFYSALDRLIVGTSPLKVVSKVAIDQVCWAPIFTAGFFAFLGFAERKTVDEVMTKVKNDTWTGVTTSWKVSSNNNIVFNPKR